MIYLYKILGFILIPYIKLNVRRRIKKGKELKSRYKERFGITTQSNKLTNKVIWIHAASIGEFKSIVPIIKKLNNDDGLEFLITTTTLSSSNLAGKEFKNFYNVHHRFFPLDVHFLIEKFLLI